MSEALKRRMRCAVYTRKSTDEGLDQEYNSIDASVMPDMPTSPASAPRLDSGGRRLR